MSWELLVLLTPVWSPASLWSGKVSTQHLCKIVITAQRIFWKISKGEQVHLQLLKPLQWSCEVCVSALFSNMQSQPTPSISPALKHQVAVLQASCVHPLQKLRRSLSVSNGSHCHVSFHFSGTHLRLSHCESIVLKKVLLEPVLALSKETQLPPHFQVSFKSSHYSMQPERKWGTCSPKNAITMLFMVPRIPSGSYGIVDW